MNKAHNSLKKINNQRDIFSHLNNSKLRQNKIIAWKALGDHKVMAELKIDTIRKFNNELILTAINGTDENLKQIISGGSSINLMIVEQGILFSSDIKEYNVDQKMTLIFPKIMAQAERRKHLRLFIDENMKCLVEFFKASPGALSTKIQVQKFDKKCHDLSVGGLSFVVSKAEAKFFKVGDVLENIQLLLDEDKSVINAQIVNVLEISPDENAKLQYKGYKVCLKFGANLAQVLAKIEKYVFQNLRFDEMVV